MPAIYKVRDPVSKHSKYFASRPQARQFMRDHEDHGPWLEVLEYQYKWQIAVMLNDAYAWGRDDVSCSVD